MARKTKIVTIEAENRDKGKQFLITEMGAEPGEMWAFRALSAMAQGGLEIDETTKNMGMAGVFSLGLEALLRAPWNLLEPLLVEMFTCIKYHARAIDRDLIESDIEEISTRMMLRMEVFKLHVDFSSGESPSISPETTVQTTVVAPITKTFPRS